MKRLTAAAIAVAAAGSLALPWAASAAETTSAAAAAGVTAYADPVDGTTGTPLGGFGAGAVKFDAKTGTFAAITRPPADQTDYSKRGTSRFQLFTSTGGTVATSDQLTAAKKSNGRYDDDAIWPEHLVNFGTTNGVSVSMTAFSPMDSANAENMSMPYAFYDVHLTNTGAQASTAAVALMWDDASETNVANVAGSGFSSDRWAVYGASSDAGAVVSSGNDAGFLTSGTSNNAPSGTKNRTSIKVSLAPGESKDLHFVLAWYDNTDPDGAYYLGKYGSVAPIAALGLKNFDALESNAATFVNKMRGSNVPSWFVNQTVDSLANVSNNSMYKKDGRTAFAEGEWTTFGTSDQMWHAREVIGSMFPTFAWQELQYWARTQRKDGQIHHDFNYMADTSVKYKLVGWDDTEHADYRSVDKWVDLNAGFIVSVYETYQQTGDDTQLASFWPHLKAAGQRIFDQVQTYGDPAYPGTFKNSENSYDAGGDPNAFNASMSAVAYKIMTILANKMGESSLKATYQTAYDQVVASYAAKYLSNNFPVGRISESYFGGQWLALDLKLGQIWTAAQTDYVLGRLDGYYHPLYWGLGYTGGTYDEWTPYLLTHYGGLLLNTRREDQFQALQKDAYERQFNDRNNVFNMPLDILPKVTAANSNATNISGDKQYISTPSIWRNYNDVIGYRRDKSTGELWVEPKLLPEMNHTLTKGAFTSPEGYGSIDYTESGATFQNQQITVRSDAPIHVTTLHLQDYFGGEASHISVQVNGSPVTFTRSGSGYSTQLLINYNGTIGPAGIQISATGDPGAPLPATPKAPDGSQVPPGPAQKNGLATIEAEAYDATGGVTTATDGAVTYVTQTDDQDYVRYDSVGLGNGAAAIRLKLRSTKASHLELALGSVSGATQATLDLPNTNGAWQTVTIDLPSLIKDTQNVVFRFRSNAGDSSNLVDLDSFTFLPQNYKSTLDRNLWTATASPNGKFAYAAFDNDKTTRWNSSFQTGTESYTLNTGKVQPFDRIVLDDATKSPNDYPRGYQVSVSNDGTTWSPTIATGAGTVNATTITFPTQTAQYIRITQTGKAPANYWSIEELYVYNDPANTTTLKAAIDAATTLRSGDYTAGSWAPFATALASAQSVLANDQALEADVDAATKALTTAQAALVVIVRSAPVTGPVGGTVPATLGLTLGAPASFGAFTPGADKNYTATTTADVVSTAGDATLTIADPSSTATGHLVNGSFSLPSPLGGLGVVKTYSAPISHDVVTIPFTQHIGANDALRTGSYSKTLTFTLATTTP